MKGLRNLLLEEQFRLENTINKVKDRLDLAPEGSLRLSKSHNHVHIIVVKKRINQEITFLRIISIWHVNWRKNHMIKKYWSWQKKGCLRLER